MSKHNLSTYVLPTAALLIAGLVGFYCGYMLKVQGKSITSSHQTERYHTVERDTVFVVGNTTVVNLGAPDSSIVRTHTSGDSLLIREVPYVVPTDLVVNEYERAIADSSLTGTLKATVQGDLLDWDFVYQIHYPQITTFIRDSVVVTNTTTSTNTVFANRGLGRLFGGLRTTALISSDGYGVTAGPYVGVRLNRYANVSYGYGMPVAGDLGKSPIHNVTLSVGL